MDHPNRRSDKSYSEVMNEWAAQRHFVHGNRSRLIHPPWDAHPVMKVVGYLGRIAVLILLPLMVFVVLLHSYGRSPEFNTMLSGGIAPAIQAEKTTTHGAIWKFDGMLVLKGLKATGRPDAFYEQLEAKNVGTRVPIGMIFRREWMLPRVSIEELSIALRSGGLGKVPLYELNADPEDEVGLPSLPRLPGPARTGALSPTGPAPLRAGFSYGIAPDFSALGINAVQMARLHASWGSSPATAGAVNGMQTDLTRTTAGWVISGNGGEFRQGWLDGMKVEKLAATIGAQKVAIEEVALTRAGGGKANFSGSMTLGELPEVDAELKLESIRLQDLVAAPVGGLFTAEASGTVKISGSMNRSSGVRMEGTLEFQTGRLMGLPILKALHQLTGEDQFRQLPLRTGKFAFSTSGSEDHGGLIVEIKELDISCGSLARLKGNYRQEQIRESGDPDGKPPVDRLKASGLFRIGVPAMVTAKLKPAVAARFFKLGEDGLMWMDLPVENPVDSTFSRALAAEILKADAGGL